MLSDASSSPVLTWRAFGCVAVVSKSGPQVFEFIPANPTVFNLCYARMSYYLGLKYYGFARNKVTKADADYVKDKLANKCPD